MNLEVVLERTIEGAPSCGDADRDHDVVDALRRGEPMAAEPLVSRYGERAYRLASRITGSAADAEEVVQDAFWAVIRKIDTFRGESAFGSWLYRIVANAAYQKLRGQHSHRYEVSFYEVLPAFDERGGYAAPVADWSPALDQPDMQAELRTELTSAIDDLPPAYRAVMVLRNIEGRSSAEIAETLGITIALVKTRAHRARLFLRKRLNQRMTTSDMPTTSP
jgi:RNA polymerase sigma-70 factor, ECF subfamily